MKTLHKTIRAFVAVIGAALLIAAAPAMNNDDVVRMIGAGLSEDIIINAIRTAETDEFDVSPDALISLKRKDVSDVVIQAMQTRSAGQSGRNGETDREAGSIDYNDVPDEEMLPPTITPEARGRYYTRYTCKFEKGKRLATNYWRGVLIPINTEVDLIGIKRDSFTLRIGHSSETVVFENVSKYTNRSVEQLLEEFLADEVTPIERYGDDMARFIRTGTVRLGMTKTQVLLTRGYPPAHSTSSLDLDNWQYWSSRFVVQTLVFDHEVLVQGRGLY